MAGFKEITNKIKSVQSTRKITKAMEMVSASKMKKAQDRMRASRPYVERTFNIVMHIAKANTEYRHPFLAKARPGEARRRDRRHHRQGSVRRPQHQRAAPGAYQQHKEWRARASSATTSPSAAGDWVSWQRMGANVVASVVQLGDRPRLDSDGRTRSRC